MRSVLLARLRHQRRSAVAVGLAVMLAVAFVAVVLAATSTVQRFVADGSAPRAAVADVHLSVPSLTTGPDAPASLTPELLDRVRSTAGVDVVDPARSDYLLVTWPDGRTPGEVSTVAADPRLAWYEVVRGAAPRAAGDVLVDEPSADKLGIAVGDRIAVQPWSDEAAAGAAARVSGVFRTTGPSLSGRTVLAAPADLDRWSQVDEPYVGEASVLLRPGADADAVVAALDDALPGLDVRTGEDAARAAAVAATGDVDVLGRIFLGFTAIALVVATIVVGNTFTIMLAQRTRELAMLRCVGATRRQLVRSTRTEALVLGLVASVAGVLLAAAVVAAAVVVLPSVLPRSRGLAASFTPFGLLLPLVVGVVLTAVAAMLPARRATRVAPLAALRPQPAPAARRAGRVRLVLGTLLGLGGALLVAAAAVVGSLAGVLVGMVGGAAVVFGVVLVGPVLVPFVTRLVGAPLGLAGPVARLAVANTRRNPARSAATSTALFVGVCLISVLTVGAATSTRAAEREIAAQAPVDVVVAASGTAGPAAAGGQDRPGGALGDGVRQRLAALPGTTAVAALRTVEATREDAPDGDGALPLSGGDPAALAAVFRAPLALDERTVLVPAYAVDLYGGEGADTTWTADGRTVTLTVRGLAGIDVPLVAAPVLDRLGAGDAATTLWLRAQDDVDAGDYRADVQTALGSAAVMTGGAIEQRAELQTVVAVLLGFATGLLAVSVLISLVGVGNTLALSVHERARESAVQRAVGMTRRQLRAGLAVEALLLAGVGCLVGVVVGSLLGWAGAVTLTAGLVDDVLPVVPWRDLTVVVVGAVGAAVLASVLPGRRAARVRPTEALAMT